MKKEKINVSETKKQADKVVKKHVLWAMAAGAIPIPMVDLFGVSAIQLDMLKQLCKIYDIDYDANQGKNLVAAFVGSTVARIGASAFKSIPIVGMLLGTISMSILSGATTYAVAHVFISNFEDGVGIFEINLEKGEKLFKDAFERGKDYVENLKDDIGTTVD